MSYILNFVETSFGGGESLTLRKEKGRFVCLSLLKQANRSFFSFLLHISKKYCIFA